MRRLLPTLVLALALLPLSLAFAGDAKEFKAQGVNWKLPDGWSFNPVSSTEKNAGFFAKVECESASVEVWAYARATEGLTLDERVAELKQEGAAGMGKVAKSKTLDTTVSGVKGKVVVQRIQADGDTEGHFRKYVIVSGGTFYQLLMRCWHGAHTDVTDEINAVRAGFRLAKGAGGEDAAEKMTEVEDPAKAKPKADEDGKAGGTNGGGNPHGARWHANGAKRDGKAVTMDSHNFHWTLPEDSPFNWVAAPTAVTEKTGHFLQATGRVARKKQEYEKNTPDFNFCQIDVILPKTEPGFKAVDWIKGGGAEKQVVETWKAIDDLSAAKTRTKDSVKFGNHKAAFIKFEGKHKGAYRSVMLFVTVLAGKAYMVRAICWGHTDAYKQMAPVVGNALSGLKFPNTDEPTRGPLLGMIPDYAGKRGKNVKKKKKFTSVGFAFEKPKGIANVKVRDGMNRDVRFVGEGRTEDGKAYMYFEIRAFKLDVPKGQIMPRGETLIEKRAQDWEAGAGKEAELGNGKKLRFKKGSFARGKGETYEFTGHLGKEPVVERGWLVKSKRTLLWFKMQFIGKDAPNRLKKLAKAVEKGVRLSK